MTPTVLYKRATFVTQLPKTHLYTASHSWLAQVSEGPGAGRWRAGYTKFALRMLGELVDVQFERQAGGTVQTGEIIGSVEGFKAISDIYCVGTGEFFGGNPALSSSLEGMVKRPYESGWLYEFAGQPDGRAMNVEAYCALLDTTIDRILAKQQHESTA